MACRTNSRDGSNSRGVRNSREGGSSGATLRPPTISENDADQVAGMQTQMQAMQSQMQEMTRLLQELREGQRHGSEQNGETPCPLVPREEETQQGGGASSQTRSRGRSPSKRNSMGVERPSWGNVYDRIQPPLEKKNVHSCLDYLRNHPYAKEENAHARSARSGASSSRP